jgi:hypothetical protein
MRREDDRKLLRQPKEGEVEAMFEAIERELDDHPLVGVASREGANRNTEKRIFNTRILRVLAYRTDTMRQHGIRFDRVPVMEDFDVALQLLGNGYQNVVLNDWAHNQEGSGLKGGCSTYRTMEMQAQAAHELARLHPGVVRVVQKSTKTAWGGGTRTDVIVAWKQAYARSR